IRDRQQQLLDSESRYRSLIAASTNLVWRTDPEGNITSEMPEWSHFTGESFEKYQGWGWTEAIHPHDREAAMRTFCQALDTSTPWVCEFRLRRGQPYRR